MHQVIVRQLRVVVFGASGMVGAAVLQECLHSPYVLSVLVVGRTSCGFSHPKLTERLVSDLANLSEIESDLHGLNACFFTVGCSAAGRSEAEFSKLNFELPLTVAKHLLELNPDLAFNYVSGAGCDSTEKGRVMWARVKGRTENALLALPFRRATMFRLAGLVPVKDHKSKTRLYRMVYTPLSPLLPLMARLLPGLITTPRILGRAMIRAAQGRSPTRILEPIDIDHLGR
ncbi:MAG TPA: epimerase [Fibrobacteria bacterium]|nr:epimerase [Fibrobacteria bacterium]